MIDWIKAVRANEARKNAGDPGVVLARRLSNAEYNYTIRDLTGEDMQPTREFPVDPANPAGFDNSGESLTMSPALLNKYLQAAREVADHMVLTPRWVRFRALSHAGGDGSRQVLHPADRRLLRQPAHRLCRLFRGRLALQPSRGAGKTRGHAGGHRRGIEGQREVSAHGLAASRRASKAAAEEVGPIAKLQAMWRALPAPDKNNPDAVKEPSVRSASRCATSWCESATTRRCSSPRRW